MADSIYLDHAAATPLDDDVIAAMQPYFATKFYNPSAVYLVAKAVAADIAAARQKVAGVLGVRPAEITFTAGGTEANNLAIHGVMSQFPGAHMVVSAVEHDSVLESAKEYDHSVVKVNPDGRINLEAFEAAITDKTVLVSVMYVNNEIGTVMPLAKIAKIIAQIRTARQAADNILPLYFHTDAAQAPLYFDLHVTRLGVDLFTLNGGKIYGPKQSGLLYANASVELAARIIGGGQEFGRRSGTENVPAIIGLSHALSTAAEQYRSAATQLGSLQKLFFDEVAQHIPQAVCNGSQKYRTPNNVHLTLPGTDNERLIMELDERGIMCAVGSACSASSDQPSHVLKAIGLSDEHAQASLRFTMGKNTTKADIRRTVEVLAELVA